MKEMMLPSFFRVCLVLSFMLTGSVWFGCASKSTRFYVLNPLDSGTGIVNDVEAKDALSVEVVSLRLPQYLERPQIVTRSSENRLELAEYHQWGGSLRKNMIRVLAKNLSQLLETPNIAISPHRPPVPPDFRVELEVMRFERDFDGQVRLSAQWRLSYGEDQRPLATRMTELTNPEVSAGTDFEQTVSAMSALYGELSRIIAREILKEVHGGPGP
jgi:uncharacterized lipoprotein YmbA